MGYDYFKSVEIKNHVRTAIRLHLFLALFIKVQIGVYYAKIYVPRDVLVSYDIEIPLVPKPQRWQYIWLAR